MRILGLDFETTGLDTSTARITEMGVALWDVPTKRPLMTVGAFLHDSSYPPQSDEIVRLTGITDEMLREFGTPPAPNLGWLKGFCEKHQVRYICAHNGENYDKPLLMSEMARNGIEVGGFGSIPWIDSRTDIPFPTEPDSRKLNHLALDAGFINPFAHRAVFDVLTMLRIVSNYDIDAIIQYQSIPFVTCRAVVGFNDKDKAKALRYSWEKIGTEVWPRMWIKKVKLNQFDVEVAKGSESGFQVVRLT